MFRFCVIVYDYPFLKKNPETLLPIFYMKAFFFCFQSFLVLTEQTYALLFHYHNYRLSNFFKIIFAFLIGIGIFQFVTRYKFH